MWTKKAGDDYPHKHRCELDGEGTGVTVHTSHGPPHTHDVENYKLAEAEGHTHELQDGSSEIRGYTNSGEAKVETDDKPGAKSIADKLAKKMAEESDRQMIKIEVEVQVPANGK